MGRQETSTGDQIVIHSSIALLQERFRQLKRLREMREGREIVKRSRYSSTATAAVTAAAYYEPSKLFFRPEIFMPPPRQPASQVYLSLWPNSQIKSCESRGDCGKTDLMKPRTADKPLTRDFQIRFSDVSDHSVVDTSLHL